MNSSRVGNISEAKVLAKAVEKGWSVLVPFGNCEHYDLVIDRGQGLETVQVKTGRYRGGCVEFNAYSIAGRTSNQQHTSYQDKVDLFAVYYPPLDSVYLLEVSSVSTTKPLLRLDSPVKANNRIKWAKDFLVL